MLLLGHTKSLFLRLAGSSFISVVKPPPHRAISALTAALSKTHEVKSSDVKVSVWWDFDKCCFPADENVVKIAENITSAVRTNGIKGPITINGYGDLLMLSKKNQEAIFPNGISLIHVPHGGDEENIVDRSLVINLVDWVIKNPAPAHLFIISTSGGLEEFIDTLRKSNYNILVASREEHFSHDLMSCSAASIIWDWNALSREENYTGKHFNQPHDGPYKSLYGHTDDKGP